MHKGYKCLEVSIGRVFISGDVIFNEEIFPFSQLDPKAGARLRSEIVLLHPTLFHHNYVDTTVHDHVSNDPSIANLSNEFTGENSAENGDQNPIQQEENTTVGGTGSTSELEPQLPMTASA
jgi:hypothetical protein